MHARIMVPMCLLVATWGFFHHRYTDGKNGFDQTLDDQTKQIPEEQREPVSVSADSFSLTLRSNSQAYETSPAFDSIQIEVSGLRFTAVQLQTFPRQQIRISPEISTKFDWRPLPLSDSLEMPAVVSEL